MDDRPGAEDPAAVWDLIRRADEFVKYAPNRDPTTARARAREQLDRAAEAAAALTDPGARDALMAQVQRRLHDLKRSDAEG